MTANGSILAGGLSEVGIGDGPLTAEAGTVHVLRYSATGAPDSGYGSGGDASLPLPPPPVGGRASEFAAAPDGGAAVAVAGDDEIHVVRFTPHRESGPGVRR